MKKNDIYEILITGISDEGYGVGRAEGIVVFVPFALIGETVRVVIIKVLKSYSVGKILDVVSPSKKRIKSSCEFFYKCGGCCFQNVDYEEELKYKKQFVDDCIRKISKLCFDISDIIGAKETFNYRNKSQFPVSPDGIGIYAPKSHRVIDMNKCLIQAEDTEVIIKTVREWMNKYNISPYDEQSDTGCIRHIYTRSGKTETMVVIVTRTKKVKFTDELVKMLRQADDRICSVMQNINLKRTNVVLGEELKVLWGKDYITDSIGDKIFKISAFSFYQVNNEQTKVLYDVAAKFADIKKTDTVWDLYCGIGTIGQYVASGAKKIVGVEIVDAAVKNAEENAKINNLKNCEYFCGSAEKIVPKLLAKGYNADIVILDPPRKGCDLKLLETVVKSNTKKIVYISCKPSTLARDLVFLTENGYKVNEIQPVDLFPRTSHVETVVLLSK